MQPVILISSCRKDANAGNNEAIRATWGSNSAIPYFFILGDGNIATHPDEIVLPVKDDYFSLPFKTQEGHRWARNQGYDYMFQCFTDTFIDTERLAASDFTRGDFVGNKGFNPAFRGFNFCHGGPGYWLSPKATDIILAANIGKENLEDQWVAFVMKSHGIEVTDDKRYSMGFTYNYREQVPLPTNSQISCHLSDSAHSYQKEMMYGALWQRFPELKGK
jgi:hypothetical protein